MRWLGLVYLAACGRIGFSETPPTDGRDPDAVQLTQRPRAWTNGTRLRAHVLSGGGAVARRGWYDTVLDTPCAFRATTGGERCVSTQRLSPSATYYADAACSQSLFQLPGSACGPTTAYQVVEDATGVTAVTAGVPHTAAVYRMPGCTLAVAPMMLYDTTQAIDLATLVGATTTLTDAAGVGFAERVADDMARELGSELRDLSTRTPCDLDADVPGLASCIPKNIPQGTPVFLDAACTQPAMIGPSNQVPAWLSVPPADFCSDDRVFYPVITSVATTTVYRGTACSSLTLGVNAAVYLVGAAKARSAFPSGTIEISGTGRLLERTWVSDRLELPLGLWDSIERVVCYYGPSDGATTARCLPDTTHSFAQTLALDATCQSSAYHTADCRPPTYNPYGLGPACDHSTNTPPVLGTVSPTPHTNISGTCVPVQAPAGTTFHRYSGQATPAANFQLMTLTIE